MTPHDFIAAARCPASLAPQTFGLWNIDRLQVPWSMRRTAGCSDHVVLSRWTDSTIHKGFGEVVMEDTPRELRKHLPCWMNARGRVLKTGLGLGCVVRGLCANPDVDRIEVIEIDPDIVRIVGSEFAGNPRVGITLGDAFEVELPGRFDFAWHDIWSDRDAGEPHLNLLHAQLLFRWRDQCDMQGAWDWPRYLGRRMPDWFIGAGRSQAVVGRRRAAA